MMEAGRMTHSRGVPQFGSWSVPQCRIVIEYDLEVLEAIRHAGYRAVPRRGIEVGGLLFGTYDGVQLRVLEHCPFSLNESTMDVFAQKLLDYNGEGLPEGQGVVGWYHLCKRSGLDLPPEDVNFHEQNFPEPWHVALLLRPDMNGTIHSRFFLREPERSPVAAFAPPGVRPPSPSVAPAPTIDPSLEAMHHAIASSSAAPAREKRPEPVAIKPVPLPPRPSAAPPSGPRGLSINRPLDIVGTPVAPRGWFSRSKKKLWWGGGAAVLALAALSTLYIRSNSAKPAPDVAFARLDVANRGGKLELSWDTRSFADARRGELEIRDGKGDSKSPLDAGALAAGRFEYTPTSDVTAFHLTALRADGTTVEGSTTYVMPVSRGAAETPAPAPADPEATEAARSADPPKEEPASEEVKPPPKETARERRARLAKERAAAAAEARLAREAERAKAPVKTFTPPPAATQTARTSRANDPVMPVVDPVQVAQSTPRLTVPLTSSTAAALPPPPAPAVTKPAVSTPAVQQQPAPPRIALGGKWQLQSGGYSRSPAAPESVTVSVSDVDGVVRGTLEARYKTKNKTERVKFSFAGQVGKGNARFPWTGSDGERGQIEFIRVPNSPDIVEIVWYRADSKQVFDELLKRTK